MPEIDLARLALQPTWIRDIRPYATVLPFETAPTQAELRRFLPQRLQDTTLRRLGPETLYHASMGEALVTALKDLGLAGARVGFDNLGVGLGMTRLLPNLKPIAAENDFRFVRQQKTVAEIALLRQATAINQAAQVRALRQWHPGMSYRELVFAFQVESLALGGSPNLPDTMQLCSSPGPDHAVHADLELNDHPLAPGMHVIFDCHGKYNGYCWDGGKTWVVAGEPDARTRRNWAATVACMHEINRAAKPGARISDLATLGRHAVRQSGVSDDGMLIYFHGLGLDHIDIDLGTGERNWAIEKDSILTTHVYFPGGSDERLYIEDICLVRDDGVERFFTWDDELH